MILDHYIARTVIMATLLVSVVVIGIQSFLALIQQISFVGQNGYTIWKACSFTLMQLPAEFYQIFPMAGFLGAMVGLSRLSATSQLIVMRVSGVSVARIMRSEE